MSDGTDSECIFCGEDRVVERHHIVPRRYNGSDGDENLVDVCPTCHAVLEKLYNRRFYDAVGATRPDEDGFIKGVRETIRVFNEADWDRPETLGARAAEKVRMSAIQSHYDYRANAASRAADELLPERFALCEACERVKEGETCGRCGTKP